MTEPAITPYMVRLTGSWPEVEFIIGSYGGDAILMGGVCYQDRERPYLLIAQYMNLSIVLDPPSAIRLSEWPGRTWVILPPEQMNSRRRPETLHSSVGAA